MKERLKEHIVYYISLFAVLTLGMFIALKMSYNKQTQLLVVVITTFFYVVLGIIHHKANHDLSTKIVIEYVLIGSLAMTIIAFLLRGAL